jgi:hypothetical protein
VHKNSYIIKTKIGTFDFLHNHLRFFQKWQNNISKLFQDGLEIEPKFQSRNEKHIF